MAPKLKRAVLSAFHREAATFGNLFGAQLYVNDSDLSTNNPKTCNPITEEKKITHHFTY
jgi:hypothetical protein